MVTATGSGGRPWEPCALLFEAISVLLPETFTAHANWKSDNCHDVYWSPTASADHVTPVSVGSTDVEENWATRSAARNMVRRLSPRSPGWCKPRRNVGTERWERGVSSSEIMERHRPVLVQSSIF